MAVDYKNCDYLSPHNSMKYAYLWGDLRNGQEQYICNKVMLLTRKLHAQYQQYNKTFHKIFPEEIPLLLLKVEELKRCKRWIIRLLFIAAVGIALDNVSVFI